MSKTINTKIDDGILTFTFTNNQNEIFASFRLNPTDVNIAARAEEVVKNIWQYLSLLTILLYIFMSEYPFYFSS